jgi:hypothetical protein
MQNEQAAARCLVAWDDMRHLNELACAVHLLRRIMPQVDH